MRIIALVALISTLVVDAHPADPQAPRHTLPAPAAPPNPSGSPPVPVGQPPDAAGPPCGEQAATAIVTVTVSATAVATVASDASPQQPPVFLTNRIAIAHSGQPARPQPPKSGTPQPPQQSGPKREAKTEQLPRTEINKPSLTKGTWKTPMGPKLREALPAIPYTLTAWKGNRDWIPIACKDMATKGDYKNNVTYSPMDMDTFSVKYGDCGSEWLICQHKDAQVSKEELAETFGRLPVRLRSMIRHIGAIPTKNNASWAYNSNDNVVMMGEHSPDRHIGVWIHELGHSIDKRIFGTSPNTRFSLTKKWAEALEQDTAVISEYSKSSQVENFADSVAAAFYDRFVPGGLRDFFKNDSASKISHQIKLIKDAMEEYVSNKNDVCRRRLTNDKPVRKRGGTARRSREGAPPDVSLGAGIEEWENFDDDENHECTCGHHH